MELRHLRYFMVVAEEQSFSQAARRLGISQPPLSMQIKALEAEIGTELFYRSSQGAELTPAGQAFLAELYPIQQQIKQAVQHAQNIANGEVGELRLGFTGTSMLNPLVTEAIRQFRRQYPKIPLKLKEANSLLLIEQVEQDQLDIAILRPPKQPAAGLTIQLLQQEQLVAALPVDYPVSGDHIHLSELAAKSFIVSPYEISSGLYDAIVGACHKAGFEPIFGPQAPQIVSILSLVSANLGVTLVPESTQQLNIRGIKYVQLQDSPAHVGLALAHKQNYHSQTAINFASIVHTVLNQQKKL